MKNLDEYDRLYKLIRVAVHDLTLCEQLPQTYEVNMDRWFVPQEVAVNERCTVCFAGAVMAQTAGCVKADWDIGVFVASTYQDKCKYFALDQLRCGDIEEAVLCFYDLTDDESMDEPEQALMAKRIKDITWATGVFGVTEYEDNSTEFKAVMLRIADKLEALDL